jgi:hypothetical protein
MKRSENGVNLHRFCEGLGIRVRPIAALKYRREPNTIYGGRMLARLLKQKGEDHTYIVLRCIQVSNRDCFFGDVIWAMHRFIHAHRPQTDALTLANEFRLIDIGAIRLRAQRLALGRVDAMTKKADALATLIADKLEKEDAA